MTKLSDRIKRRQGRVRGTLRRTAGERKRLSVFRSSKHIYAQVIDDDRGVTLVAASSIEKSAREGLKTGASVAAAKTVGKLIAARAQEKGIKDVVFDRGSYLYHGRVKALAEAAREGQKSGASVDAAKTVGKLIAERAKEKGVKDVVFDRGGYLYHGRVKALAEAAREGGLNF